MEEASESVRIKITQKGRKALSNMVKLTITNDHKPIVVSQNNQHLLCPIDGEQVSGGRVWICNDCGQIYHDECIQLIRENSPELRCADRLCVSRRRGLPLLQVVKTLG